MDFPFEYVERVWDFPDLDTRKPFNRKSRRKPIEYPESEELERDAKRPELVLKEPDVKEMRKKIDELKAEVYATTERTAVKNIRGLRKAKNCFEPEEERWTMDDENLSVDETSSDGINEMFGPRQEVDREKALVKKFRIMQHCACTDSACESASPIPDDVSSLSTSSESCDDYDKEEKSRMKAPVRRIMSSESSESSEDEVWGLDEEIAFLKQVLEQKKQEEREKGGKGPSKEKKKKKASSAESTFDNIEETISIQPKGSKEQTSKEQTSKEQVSKEETSKEQEPSTAVGESSSSSPDSSSSKSTTTSESAHSHVTLDFATPPLYSCESKNSSLADLDDQQKVNLVNFCWESDDLHVPSATDSDFERDIQNLDKSWDAVAKEFSKLNDSKQTKIESEKNKNFVIEAPETVKSAMKSYQLLEEATDKKKSLTQTHVWLVQQMETGRMCSAKLMSRKDPAEISWQKTLVHERKMLRELLPELSVPSHIAKLLDVGVNEHFQFLIFEDLGTDLSLLCAEFMQKFDFATIFLITYFSLMGIKELHYLGYLHLDIRPSAFSIIHAPFNIKIKSYGRVEKKVKKMKAPLDIRPDSFSPRAAHKKSRFLDEYGDIESWIYTMVYLCGRYGIPWYGRKESMHADKEQMFNAARSFNTHAFKGCSEPVIFAAHLMAKKKLQYRDFWQKMDKMLSVEVMQFSDWTQPVLWRFHELKRVKQHFAGRPDMYWDQQHWNPAEQLDPVDEDHYEEKEAKWDKDMYEIRENIRRNSTWRRQRWGDRLESNETEQETTTTSSPSTTSESSTETRKEEEQQMTQLEEDERTENEESQKPEPSSDLSPTGSEANSLGMSPKSPSAPGSSSPVPIDTEPDSESSSDITSTGSWASTWTSSSGSCSDALLLWDTHEPVPPMPEVESKLDDFEMADFETYQQLMVGMQEEGLSTGTDSDGDVEPLKAVMNSEDERTRKRDEGLLVNMVQWKNRFHQKNFFRPRPQFKLIEPTAEPPKKGAKKPHLSKK